MRTTIINVKEIEPYLKWTKLKNDLQVRLHLLNKYKKLELENLKAINIVAKHIGLLKQKHKFKLEDDEKEIAKLILKNGDR